MEVNTYNGKKIAILGFGDEGKSAYDFFNQAEALVEVFDEFSSDRHPKNTTVAKAEDWELDEFDFVVRTPGLALHRLNTTARITSATQLFLELCPATIVGVTGTKGKGTTSTLITKILKEAGVKVQLLGNIGDPALDKLKTIEEDDTVVFEMSSFQLWNVTISPHIAVVLMVEPEHLDVHEDLDDYLDAKSNITKHQSAEDVAIIHPFNEMSHRVGMNGVGVKKKFMNPDTAHIDNGELMVGDSVVMPVTDFGLIGPHNRENICAAVTAAWEFTQDIDAIKRAVTNFKGLEHRLEFVREIEGIKYYNDSFATTPGATIAAIKSFSKPEVLILGGSDKQSDYSDLAETVAKSSNIQKILLIGVMAEKIDKALKSFGYEEALKINGDMKQIVTKAAGYADKNGVVLLSPACASFDMFDNYKQRGELFKKAVRDL